MNSPKYPVCLLLLVVILSHLLAGQQQTLPSPGVPRLVNFSGKAIDDNRKVVSGISGVTFAIYKDQFDGAPLWMETQNVTADSKGSYTVQLGASTPDGLPLELFSSGEARWLGVRINGGQEQPRVLLLSVPYALKAADAQTLGGLPVSAFVLAATPRISGSITESQPAATLATTAAAGTIPVTTAGGTVNKLARFDAKADVTNSLLFDNGTNVGIGNTAPAAKLDVSGTGIFRGALTLPATATAIATAGKNSQPFNFTASAFNSGTATAVNQTFRWQAEAVGNNTASPLGKLNLLFASGTASPKETGLSISNTGIITFATGQKFPGSGGTVTSVGLSAPTSDFKVSGSPVTSSGTLALNWSIPPSTNAVANAIVKRDASGSFGAHGVSSQTLQVGVSPLLVLAPSTVQVGSGPSVSTAIYGTAEGAQGLTYGVAGNTQSGSAGSSGVVGLALNSGGAGENGVFGQTLSPLGVGVYGQKGGRSNVGAPFAGAVGIGVWGDGGGNAYGVLGTVDNGYGGVFETNTASSPALYAQNFGSGFVFEAFGNGGDCEIDGNGNLACTGTITPVVAIDNGARKVGLSAIESPNNWFEDAGSAELVNGSAVVVFRPDFLQTVNTEMNYMVFPVPNGDCRGLYVTNKTPRSFEVRELGGGTASLRFDYRIMALRKNYENVRFADHTADADPRQQMEQFKRRVHR